MPMMYRSHFALWPARLVLGVVFFLNVSCALVFILWPERYSPGFEVSGVSGAVIVRGIGILFLMWNATYPAAIRHPWRHRDLFLVVILQQIIGVSGETWMLLTVPPGHTALLATGRRFVAFDGAGLTAMLISYIWMWALKPRGLAGRGTKGVPNERHTSVFRAP